MSSPSRCLCQRNQHAVIGASGPPRSRWRFCNRLFTEMYGFPLTIYLLSGWLGRQFPGVDFWSHDAGHLLETLFGWRVNPHFGPFHILSTILIFGGFWLLAV
ncbi:hypothetical protein V5F77_28580, partial [Xanthobacter sp. DSM 24535]